MTATHEQMLKQILEEAVKVPPQQRQQFLDGACGRDEELRSEVESLLAALEKARDFLEAPTMEPEQPEDVAESPEIAGKQIGPYKLLQQIGEGGMGIVYMAEQQRPVRRRVALKIIKPGMDSAQWRDPARVGG